MRLAFACPITYWSRIEQISLGVGRSDRGPLPPASPEPSSRMMSLQRSMHSSQMNTDGPAISFFTSCWLLPQKEQYRSFSLDPFRSVIVRPLLPVETNGGQNCGDQEPLMRHRPA